MDSLLRSKLEALLSNADQWLAQEAPSRAQRSVAGMANELRAILAEPEPSREISTAPKDRAIRVYEKRFGWMDAKWSDMCQLFLSTQVAGLSFADATHWTEQTEPPK